jgi:hypothetical protein
VEKQSITTSCTSHDMVVVPTCDGAQVQKWWIRRVLPWLVLFHSMRGHKLQWRGPVIWHHVACQPFGGCQLISQVGNILDSSS